MSLYEILLILHLFGVVLLVSGHAVATATGFATARTSQTRTTAMLLRIGTLADHALITPGTLIAVGFGLWLVSETGFGFDEPWLLASYALIVVAVILGAAILGPAASRLKVRADELLADGVEESDELRQMAADPKVGVAANVETLVILTFLVLMVAKPGS